jgi:hypothetical protein
MKLTPESVKSIEAMKAKAQADYLARIKREVCWAKEARQRDMEAAEQGRLDALMLMSAGFVVETNYYCPFQELRLDIGDARKAKGKAAVEAAKVEIATILQGAFEKDPCGTEVLHGPSGKTKITLRHSKAKHVLVSYVDTIRNDKPGEKQKCRIVRRVQNASRRVEYSLECEV